MAETRRRGEALESAILDAAWAELVERGFGGMTYESVAERAGTSKPVIYRRWPNKQDLLLAAIHHKGVMLPIEPANTGSLRGDVTAALRRMNSTSGSMAGLLSSVLGSYFTETGVSIADLRAMIFGDGPTGMQKIVANAVERGELPPGGLPARVTSLPTDLMRHEFVTTFAAVPDETIIDIVDTVFLPLVRATIGEANSAK